MAPTNQQLLERAREAYYAALREVEELGDGADRVKLRKLKELGDAVDRLEKKVANSSGGSSAFYVSPFR